MPEPNEKRTKSLDRLKAAADAILAVAGQTCREAIILPSVTLKCFKGANVFPMTLQTLVVLFLLLLALPAHADITGKARIVDGDTIHIGDTKIRLHGIDAPEMKQTCRTSKGKEQMCGVLAKQAFEKLVRGQDVTCKGDTRDRYKRLIAVCYVGPLDINEQMVTDGWAMAYRKYSKDYVRAETFAKARREGMWLGEFVPPWEWRRRK